jgi:hypothetical protein
MVAGLRALPLDKEVYQGLVLYFGALKILCQEKGSFFNFLKIFGITLTRVLGKWLDLYL